MKRMLVTGASGLLGLTIALNKSQVWDVTGITKNHALPGAPFHVIQRDLAQAGAALQVVEETRPDLIIHSAAMADIDDCEKDPALALLINALLPGELAETASARSIQMIHISTDAVFDGARGDYSEDDPPNPLSVYARTKLQGEQNVAVVNPSALIARVNFFGWSLSGRRSLAEWFYNNLVVGRQINGFTDVFICPLLANHLAEFLIKMVAAELAGLYHVVSNNSISKYDFGRAIAAKFGLDSGLIQPASVSQGGLTARRSPLLTLRVDKLSRALGQTLPAVAEGIEGFVKLKGEGYPAMIRGFDK